MNAEEKIQIKKDLLNECFAFVRTFEKTAHVHELYAKYEATAHAVYDDVFRLTTELYGETFEGDSYLLKATMEEGVNYVQQKVKEFEARTPLDFTAEFEDYPVLYTALPDGFIADAWHNDLCPKISDSVTQRIVIWCDHPSPAESYAGPQDTEGYQPFMVCVGDFNETSDSDLSQSFDTLEEALYHAERLRKLIKPEAA